MEVLHALPTAADYKPLDEHQSSTPASFYGGPAVLHLVLHGLTLSGPRSEIVTLPALARLVGADTDAKPVNGDHPAHSVPLPDADVDVDIAGIDVWVGSDQLVLARPATSTAIAIQYPSIALHAVASGKLYLQLAAPDYAGGADEDGADRTVSLYLTPPSPSDAADAAASVSATADNAAAAATSTRPVDALYTAVSACADLHPDPAASDDDEDGAEGAERMYRIIAGPNTATDGGAADDDDGPYEVMHSMGHGNLALPPPVPGSGGWITAENMHEYFDDEGNFKGAPHDDDGALGAGAGTVRARDENDNDDHGGGGGGGGEDDDGGNADLTKWQRTG